ncbi:MAG: MerR family transcriptional regulator [Lachnospiraceae bacterium]|nr:MerR family transcriptional regulator [Lachnospiraceae bacterium]
MIEENRLFTISQVASICSTSRSTILRMEKDNILTPSFVNEENGYRYYDQESIIRVMRNLSFQEVGLTHKELKDYYSADDNYEKMLSILNGKLRKLHAMVDVLMIETQRKDTSEIDFFTFQEVYCYRKEIKNVKDKSLVSPLLAEALKDTLNAGLSLDRVIHPFITVDAHDFLESGKLKESYDFAVNIPIMYDKKAARTEGVIKCEEVNTITSYLHGGSKNIKDTFARLGKAIRENNLKIDGEARVVAIVRFLPGESIPEDFWVTRVCIPIKENA